MKILLPIVFIFLLSGVLWAQESAESLRPISVAGKKGFISRSGKMIIEPSFDEAKDFSEGLAPVLIKDKWGFIDESGKVVIAPRFIYVYSFSEGFARFFENKKFGYFYAKGQFLIEPRFDQAFDFSDGRALVKSEGKWKFIDKTGKNAFDTDFIYARSFREGRAVIIREFKEAPLLRAAYIDLTGKIVSDWFTAAFDYSEGLAFTTTDPRIGVSVSRALYVGFDYSDEFYKNPPESRSINFRVMNLDGKKVFDGDFGTLDADSNFSDGLAGVYIKGKLGYIDKTGKIVVAPQFDNGYPFSEGVTYIGIGDKRYFIDKTGKILFEARFSLSETGFKNGLAKILSCQLLNCGEGYINKEGKIIAHDK